MKTRSGSVVLVLHSEKGTLEAFPTFVGGSCRSLSLFTLAHLGELSVPPRIASARSLRTSAIAGLLDLPGTQ